MVPFANSRVWSGAVQLKLMGFLAASVGVIAGLTGAVAFLTLQRWYPPLAPTIYLSAVLLVAFIGLGAGWFVVTRRELQEGVGAQGQSAEERGLKRLVMIASQVVLGIFAIGCISLWNLDQVRERFVPLTADSHVRLELPLRDPSPVVRLAACKEFFKRGWVFRSKGVLVSALNGHPNVAKACLDAAAQNDWKGAVSMAEELGSGWEAEMLAAGPVAAERMCEVVPWVAEVDTIAQREPELRLLRCVTGAASDEIRGCCAQALTSRGKLLDVLGDPTALAQQTSGEVFAELVQFGFRPLSLPENRQKVAASLGTDDESVRRWVAQLGCSMLDPTQAQPDLINGFIPLVESRSCGLTAEQQVEYTTPSAWVRLCEVVAAAPADKPIEETVCAAVKDARVERTVVEAQILVHAAIRAYKLEDDADFVTDGISVAAAYFGDEVEAFRTGRGGGGGGASPHRYGQRASERSALKELNLTGYDDPTCNKLYVGHFQTSFQGLGKHEVLQTQDCERYDDDLTVEDFLAQKKPPSSEDLKDMENPFDAFKGEAMKKHGANGAKAAEIGAKRYKEAFENRVK